MVTGATGFLGSYIVKALLQKGYSVVALCRNKKNSSSTLLNKFNEEGWHLTWVEGDILDIVSLRQAMEGVDYVVHAAAKVSFSKKEVRSLYKTNIDGTSNVVNICLEKKIKRLIYVSSVAALGRTSEKNFITEDSKWVSDKANTHYAISKFKAELEVWRAFAEGLPGIIVNPSTILGFGNWEHSSNRIFKQMHDGFKWYTTGANGFTGVEDVAMVTVMLLETEINHERFIVNTDNWEYRKLQNTIANAFGQKAPFKKANRAILRTALIVEKIKNIFTGKPSFLTSETIKVALGSSFYSNEKLLKALPEYKFATLEDVINNAAQQYNNTVRNLP